MGPCRTAHIKIGGDHGSSHEVGLSRHDPTDRNPNPIYSVLPAMGCPTTPPSPLQGLHRSTAAPPDRCLATEPELPPTPASTLLLCRNSERREGSSPDLRVTHTEILIIDSNNGIRARLPLCNPNPNRVKETKKRPRVAEVTNCRSCRTDVFAGARQENKIHSDQRRDRTLGSRSRTLTQEQNRSNSDLRKERSSLRI